MKRLNKIFLVGLLGVLSSLLVSQVCFAELMPFKDNPLVRQFINNMVHRHEFNKQYLENLFKKAKPNEKVIQLVKKPYEMKPWPTYRANFITPKRIKMGVKFWHQHRKDLQKAEKRYGVPASVIVAIIAVESNYGAHQGEFKVFDALATLAFEYAPRSSFFRNELKEFLIFTREDHLDPLTIKGSYAGAIGLPQFMPSSYRHYAVDFGNNGNRDLRSNLSAVIGSVANYLKRHGWERNQPIVVKAVVEGNRYKNLPKQKRKPSYSIKQLASYNVRPANPDSINKLNERVSFINLNGLRYEKFWIGFKNFYVITRYNTNKQYAMVVYLLSEAIQKDFDKHYKQAHRSNRANHASSRTRDRN